MLNSPPESLGVYPEILELGSSIAVWVVDARWVRVPGHP